MIHKEPSRGGGSFHISEIRTILFKVGDDIMIVTSAIIGAALAADAFAVSVVCGAADRTRKYSGALFTAGAFALFQMFMPIVGWSIGKVGSRAAEGFDHIIAFGILVFLGIKMMFDSRDSAGKEISPFSLRSLVLLAVATSIDALTVGIALPAAAQINALPELLTAVAVIGAVTFIMCFAGYLSGRRMRKLDPQTAMLAGGAVLILVGIKTLIAG